MKTYERFLQYVKFDTQSNQDSTTYPSTEKQWLLAKRLATDLQDLGIDANVDNYGYVIGRIPGNSKKTSPKIALIAHMDTSPDANGANIIPSIVKNYDGGIIVLNQEKAINLDPAVFECLKKNIGHDLIVTDGTTLLGADDKAGIAEIMAVAEAIQKDKTFVHGDITIVFTPDEEVGRGTDFLDMKKIDADFGYTLDGTSVGEIAFENFNAATAILTFTGKSVHPGSAKGKMLNSMRLAFEFDALLPVFMRPEMTEKYEGFNHLHGIEGACEKTVSKYLIRNHDKNIYQLQKRDFQNAADFLNKKYGNGTCALEITDSYFNMREKLVDSMFIVDIAKEAILESGIEPIIEPIRGGTDGARLTFQGLPCPNLGTGGNNYHGPFEYLSITEMDLAVEILQKIVSKIATL